MSNIWSSFLNKLSKTTELCISIHMRVKLLVIQLCLTLGKPKDCSLPGYFVYGVLQARTLEWIAIPFSKGSSWHRDQTCVCCIASRFFTIWDNREAQIYAYIYPAIYFFLNCKCMILKDDRMPRLIIELSKWW